MRLTMDSGSQTPIRENVGKTLTLNLLFVTMKMDALRKEMNFRSW